MATEKKILGQLYRVDPMPAGEAIEMYADMMRIATQATGRIPAILLALSSKGEDGADVMANVAALAGIGDILRANSSSDIRTLVERIVTQAQVKRPSGYAQVNFDEEFRGRLGAILPVANLVIEVNFADFFTASVGGGLLSSLRAALASGK